MSRIVTSEQLKSMRDHIRAGRRAHAYWMAYTLTGSETLGVMLQVSSGSGLIGGYAWATNESIRAILETYDSYFGGADVETASDLVAAGTFENIWKLRDDGRYELVPEEEILAAATKVWADHGHEGAFPGLATEGDIRAGLVNSIPGGAWQLQLPRSLDFEIDVLERKRRTPGATFEVTQDGMYLTVFDKDGFALGAYTFNDVAVAVNADTTLPSASSANLSATEVLPTDLPWRLLLGFAEKRRRLTAGGNEDQSTPVEQDLPSLSPAPELRGSLPGTGSQAGKRVAGFGAEPSSGRGISPAEAGASRQAGLSMKQQSRVSELPGLGQTNSGVSDSGPFARVRQPSPVDRYDPASPAFDLAVWTDRLVANHRASLRAEAPQPRIGEMRNEGRLLLTSAKAVGGERSRYLTVPKVKKERPTYAQVLKALGTHFDAEAKRARNAEERMAVGKRFVTALSAARFKERERACEAAWAEATEADPLLAPKLADNLVTARKALDRFGDRELYHFLDDSGLANHPAVVRLFTRVGEATAADRFIRPDFAGHART